MFSSLALVVLMVEQAQHQAQAWQALLALCVIHLLMGVMAWRLFRPRGSDDGGPDSGGGGGPRREDDRPRRPPPGPTVCWPEFERQFAAYVARSSHRTPAE